MIDLYRRILEVIMFRPDCPGGVVLVAGSDEAKPANLASEASSAFVVPSELFPTSCVVYTLPFNERFLTGLRKVIADTKPHQLFLVPPFIDSRHLSRDIRVQYQWMNLEHIAMQNAIELLEPRSTVGVLLPEASLSSEGSRRFREWLAERSVVRYVIKHDFAPARLGIPIERWFRLQTVVLEVGENPDPIVRFFKCPEAADPVQEDHILLDLKRLETKQGGATEYGYVRREGIQPGSRFLYDMHHPKLQRRVEEMGHFGQVQKLVDIVTIRRGMLNSGYDADRLVSERSQGAIPLVENRNILSNGSLSLEEVRYYLADPSPKDQLQADDIVMRSMAAPGARLHAAVVPADLLPLAAGNSVLVLRKNQDAVVDVLFLHEYLRSDQASEWVRAGTSSVALPIARLQELPVPVPDETLAAALQSLRDARSTFEQWQLQAEQAISSLFDFPSARDARLHVLTSGRKLRQRISAAEQTDNFRFRLRTQFPHPIAFRWRTVEAARPDLAGYLEVLECAEVSACFLACVAIALARSITGFEIKWLAEMGRRLTTRGQGTNMGDWVSILREVRDSRSLRRMTEPVPFYEVSRFLADDEVDAALQRLKEWRDDQSHLRGPKGAAVGSAFEKSVSDLETLLRSADFLADCPLRHVEETRQDSLAHLTEYQYRELMGDHPLVPMSIGESADHELEKNSLYLGDRNGILHLMRPWLLWKECPVCSSWATFYLDGYESDGDVCRMKSMEHGHTFEDSHVASAFRLIGFSLVPGQG